MKMIKFLFMFLIFCLALYLFGMQKPDISADRSGEPFPEKIYFRTAAQSFNRMYYFLLRDGKIYVKRHDDFGKDLSGWTPIAVRFGRIEQIGVDGNQMELVYQNKIYTCNQGLGDYKKWKWLGNWGFPFNHGLGIRLPAKYRAWSVSFSDPAENKYQTDGNGNKFYTFVGSIYLLSEDGTIIHLADPWTPADWGYQIGTPLRSRFIAINISVSASLVFLIDRFGDMYTRHIDFDNMGANPTLKYTYEKIPVYPGILNREHPRKLPIADWTKQPKIDGTITGKITVYSKGEGENGRMLRVEGFDHSGNTGYYEKMLMDTRWSFIATKEKIDRKGIISNTGQDSSAKELGINRDENYSGMLGDHRAVLEDYNLYCSPARLKIEITPGSWRLFLLHTVFKFRVLKQEHPGTDWSPLSLNGVLEIPESLTADTDKNLGDFLKVYFGYIKSSGTSRFIPIQALANLKEVHLGKPGLPYFSSRFRIDFRNSKDVVR